MGSKASRLATTDGFDESEALSLAAAVEGDSEHMVARALIDAARERGLLIPAVHGFQSLPGRGVEARIDSRVLQVGGPRLLEQAGVRLPGALAQRAAAWGEHGQTVVYLLERRETIGAFALADVIRPEESGGTRTARSAERASGHAHGRLGRRGALGGC